MKRIEVVAAIIIENSMVFATERGYGNYKGKWEFPGGKIEEGESHQDALEREILEELNTQIIVGNLLKTIEYDYPNFHLTMHCYISTVKSGKLELTEHSDAKWVNKDEIKSLDWLEADLDILDDIINIL